MNLDDEFSGVTVPCKTTDYGSLLLIGDYIAFNN